VVQYKGKEDNMDIISMINYAAMNKDYTWINQIKQDIIDKVVMKNSNKAVRDVILQYIDDVIPQDPQGD
jgi:hypothetical protein